LDAGTLTPTACEPVTERLLEIFSTRTRGDIEICGRASALLAHAQLDAHAALDRDGVRSAVTAPR
jgi:hypothetical protein